MTSTWTSQTPTVPGWYFYRDTKFSTFKFVEIFAANYSGPIDLWQKHEGGMRLLKCVESAGGQWAGPIPMPEEE